MLRVSQLVDMLTVQLLISILSINILCLVTVEALIYPITGSSGADVGWILPFNCEGCGSNSEPICSEFLSSICQKRYASSVNAYWLTRMLYRTPSFSEFWGIRAMGAL